MTTGSTIYNFEIALSDITRNVYEKLSLRVAQHPSETIEYLLTRTLAYCLEYRDCIEFTKGLADSDAPAIWMHDLTGKLTGWIEIGVPSAERLHRASKKVDYLAIYTSKDPLNLLEQLKGERIQNSEKIFVHVLGVDFIAAFKAILERRNTIELSVVEGNLYLNISGKNLTCPIVTHGLLS